VCERFSVDELENQELGAVGLFETVDAGDMRMIQRRQQLRLALEPRDAFGILSEQRGETLDGDTATEAGVACPIDFAHAACADSGLNFVGTDPRAGFDGHVRWTGIIGPIASTPNGNEI